MGRSKQREIGAIIVENKKRDLAGLIKILLMKGKKGKMDVTFSAVLEIEEGNENDKKYQDSDIEDERKIKRKFIGFWECLWRDEKNDRFKKSQFDFIEKELNG